MVKNFFEYEMEQMVSRLRLIKLLLLDSYYFPLASFTIEVEKIRQWGVVTMKKDDGGSLAIGLSLGLIFGLLFDNLALGMALGVALGASGAFAIKKKKTK